MSGANEAVQFLYKHGDLTHSGAHAVIDKLCGNGFHIIRSTSLADSPEVAELVRKAVEAERARCAGIAERDGFALLKEADAWWKDKMPRAAADATAQSKSGPRIAAAIRAPADEAEGGDPTYEENYAWMETRLPQP